jgi:hypothetical protein
MAPRRSHPLRRPASFGMTLVLAGLVAAGCGRSRATQADDASAPPSRDGAPTPNDFRPAPAPDGGSDSAPDAARADGPPCSCQNPNDGVLIGSCVPTNKLRTCAPFCNPNLPDACPGQPGEQRCDPSAATPSCVTSATQPACVPGMGMALPPGALRIFPREGNAAQEAKLTISGGSLYIGALWWNARMGKQKAVPLDEITTTPCQYPATLRPPGPGIHAVEIAYGGGGGGGGKGWTLAGFYTASAGVPSAKLAQPGEQCSTQLRCAEASPYSCACVSGRCDCKRQAP